MVLVNIIKYIRKYDRKYRIQKTRIKNKKFQHIKKKIFQNLHIKEK